MESELSGIFRVKLITKNIGRGSPGTQFMHMRVKRNLNNCYFNFCVWTSQPQNVLNLFLFYFFTSFKSRCSYKICSYKKLTPIISRRTLLVMSPVFTLYCLMILFRQVSKINILQIQHYNTVELVVNSQETNTYSKLTIETLEKKSQVYSELT